MKVNIMMGHVKDVQNKEIAELNAEIESLRHSRAELYKAFDTLTDQHEALRKELEQAKATIAELQGLQVTSDICAGKIRRDALEEAAQLVGQIRWVQFINGSGHHDCRKPLPSELAAEIRALMEERG